MSADFDGLDLAPLWQAPPASTALAAARAAFAQRDECVELLMPFVHRRPGSLTLATILPPGHMQKVCAAGIPSSRRAVS